MSAMVQPAGDNQESNAQLVARLVAGEAAALAEIERRFGNELRLFCRRMLGDVALADDVVQEVWVACCRRSPEDAPMRSLRGWLYQVARNRCIDIHRRRKSADDADARGVRRAQPSYESAVDALTTPSGKALKRDRAERILAALQALDPDLREVIVMQYFQELSREDIAEAIGLTLAGAKARLRKAMQALRQQLGPTDESSA